MRFSHEGKPIAKARHRMFRNIAYDPQSKTKNKMKAVFALQFQSQGYLKPLEGAIIAQVDIRHPIPISWPKKRKITANYKTSRPDIDNCVKFYFDVLNQIAYNDDSQIVSLTSQKTYSENPGVEITLSRLEDSMVNEHVITYKDNPSIEDLNYIVKKGNRLGLTNRQILRVFKEEDEDGTHVYFAVDGLKEKEQKDD